MHGGVTCCTLHGQAVLIPKQKTTFLDRHSCPSDLPSNVFDADFFASLFIVVEPLALGEVDACEWRAGFEAFGFPVALSMAEAVSLSMSFHEYHSGD